MSIRHGGKVRCVFLACSNTTQILFLKERKKHAYREKAGSQVQAGLIRRPFRKGENIGPGRIRQSSMRCVPVYSALTPRPETAQGMPNSTGYGRSRHMQMQQTPVLIFPSARCIYVPFSHSLFRGWGSTDCIDPIRSLTPTRTPFSIGMAHRISAPFGRKVGRSR